MHTLTAPLFPIGFPVAVDGYQVVTPSPLWPARLVVIGVQQYRREELDEAGNWYRTDLTGWMYNLGRPVKIEDWGWVSEADLLSAGYAPPVPEEVTR